jgi:ubiquinone/menaquinone biosynthesis C-methylase UbiE
MNDGYRALCIVPDKAIIKIGRKKFPYVRFLESTAEQFSINERYDVALMVESYQYFSDKPGALSNISRHLSGGGCVIFVEEFSLIPDGLPRESDLVSLMESINYYPESRVDVSELVAPSCRYIYEQLEQFPEGKEFAKLWRDNEEKYKAGQRHYLLLRFMPKAVA